jgi:hypothetical protein
MTDAPPPDYDASDPVRREKGVQRMGADEEGRQSIVAYKGNGKPREAVGA